MGNSLSRAGLASLLIAVACVAAFIQPGESRADHLACHTPFRGFDFDTYEFEDYVTKYNQAIDLAAAGKAIPSPYTLTTGETIDVSYEGLKKGTRGGRATESTALTVPPSIYKSIAWVESAFSAWGNASGSVPFGGVGPTLLSTDCGYGIGQITSGMGHASAPPAMEYGVPSARQALIGTHPLFNIGEGIRILADKWNSAPRFRPIAGNGDPAAIEDWYYAIWSYNGFAFSNHPLNPSRDPLRGSVWHCGDKSAPGSSSFVRSDYTYPELVYGCLRYPPAKPAAIASAQSNPEVSAAAVGGPFAVGDLVVVVGTGDCLKVRQSPSGNELACVPDGTQLEVLGGPQVGIGANTFWNVRVKTGAQKGVEGWSADLYLTKQTNVPPPPPTTPPPTIPNVDPANRYWLPQMFFMPDFGSPEVAEAFKPQHFLDCQEDGFTGGCPAMDYPTTIPERNVFAHADTTPAVNPSLLSAFLGDPHLQYAGPKTLTLSVDSSGLATNGVVTVKNIGTWIAPFRVRTTADWIVVHHPGDATRSIDGSVAIGAETEVVTQQATASRPRIAVKGKDSVLVITLDASLMPEGASTGKVYIEPLLGGGGVFEVSVAASKGATTGLPFRNFVPGLSSEGGH